MLHGGAGKGPLGGGGIAGSAFFLHTVVVLVVVQCCGEAAQPRAVPTAQSKSLDDALALWKQLLASQGIPAVRSVEQTTASLRVTAALYRLMDKVTLLGLWRHKVSSTTALSLVVLWVFPASSLCKPWKATCWCEPCAAHLGTIWARPELSARSPNCSSSWNAPATPRQAPRGGEGGGGGSWAGPAGPALVLTPWLPALPGRGRVLLAENRRGQRLLPAAAADLPRAPQPAVLRQPPRESP